MIRKLPFYVVQTGRNRYQRHVFWKDNVGSRVKSFFDGVSNLPNFVKVDGSKAVVSVQINVFTKTSEDSKVECREFFYPERPPIDNVRNFVNFQAQSFLSTRAAISVVSSAMVGTDISKRKYIRSKLLAQELLEIHDIRPLQNENGFHGWGARVSFNKLVEFLHEAEINIFGGLRIQVDGASLRSSWSGSRVALSVCPIAEKLRPSTKFEFLVCLYYGSESGECMSHYFKQSCDEINSAIEDGVMIDQERHHIKIYLAGDLGALSKVSSSIC